MVSLLFFLHALGSQHDEDRVFMQEMVDQNSANFIVVPLFLFTPVLTFRLVELSHYLQTLLVGVVTQSVLEKSLVEIESFG